MADHFTYRVSWSEDDGEYVGACAEFPSLSHLDADQAAALRGIRDLVADVVADMTANGEPVPEPLAERTYSGKFQARVPPELHRRLMIEAAEAHVSLNRLVSLRLAMPFPAMLGEGARHRPAPKKVAVTGRAERHKRRELA
jgi:predicted HicB family RNase H-like nuclease